MISSNAPDAPLPVVTLYVLRPTQYVLRFTPHVPQSIKYRKSTPTVRLLSLATGGKMCLKWLSRTRSTTSNACVPDMRHNVPSCWQNRIAESSNG